MYNHFYLHFSMGCHVYMHTPALNVPPPTAPVRQWGFVIFRCYLSSPLSYYKIIIFGPGESPSFFRRCGVSRRNLGYRYFNDCLFAEKPACGPQSRSRLTTEQHSALSDRCQRCVRTIIVRSLPVYVFPLLSVVNSFGNAHHHTYEVFVLFAIFFFRVVNSFELYDLPFYFAYTFVYQVFFSGK